MEQPKVYNLKRAMSDAQAEGVLKGKFLDDNSYDLVVDHDADGYDLNGNLLFRFRKNYIPFEVLKTGYESFKGSIDITQGRGTASGGSFKRVRADGTVSNVTVGNKVESGIVGYMDESAMIRYCRKTAFTRSYFDKFQKGLPFVEYVDKLYKELCPKHYERQLAIAVGTNRNYRIANTSFTTITVNKNFQTAVHKDAGDFPDGFGNLCVYREGYYEGAYLIMPEYRVAVDMQNTDILFMDVHHWHGNSAFRNASPDYLRIAFVMYYREYMYKCQSPSKELERVQKEIGGFLRL